MNPTWNATTNSYDYTPYISPYGNSDPLGQNINAFAKYLTPQSAFSKVLPFDTYYAPLKAFSENDITTNTVPAWNKFTYNPYRVQAANTAAATNTGQSGYGQTLINKNEAGVKQNLSDLLQKIRDSYLQLGQQGYANEQQSYYNDPTAWTKYNPYAIKGTTPAANYPAKQGSYTYNAKTGRYSDAKTGYYYHAGKDILKDASGKVIGKVRK